MEHRLGASGVPVMGTYGGSNQEWHNSVCCGLQKAGRQLIKYGGLIGGSVGEGEVKHWLERRRRGEEIRDLYTDQYVTRGWEVDAGIVVDFWGGSGVENLAMRIISHIVVVKKR